MFVDIGTICKFTAQRPTTNDQLPTVALLCCCWPANENLLAFEWFVDFVSICDVCVHQLTLKKILHATD